MSSASSSDGVPPPRKMVSIATPGAHGASASSPISRRSGVDVAPHLAAASSGAVLNEQ